MKYDKEKDQVEKLREELELCKKMYIKKRNKMVYYPGKKKSPKK